MNKFLSFVGNHWMGIWVTVSVIGLITSILGDFKISTGVLWFAILVASVITITGNVRVVFEKVGELFWILLTGWANVAIGGRGLTALLFINGGTLFLLGLLAMSGGNKDGGALVSTFGVAMIIGGMLSVPAKVINKKKG